MAAAVLLSIIVAVKALLPPEAARMKIGYLVKMPEQAWFINEAAAARAAGREHNFDVVVMGTPDGERLMTALDSLEAQGAQGFVVCAPDVRLGPAVVAHARAAGLRVVTVDDQFLGPDGRPLPDVPHLGMSGYRIGHQAGEAIAAEMQRRGWDPRQVGALAITFNELPTAVERLAGARDALLNADFLAANIFEAPQRTTDTEGASNAAGPVFSRHADLKQWVVIAVNEDSVLGGVRAAEQVSLVGEQVIGVGIGGTAIAIAELSKSHATGFFGTIAVSSTLHGRQSALNLVNWLQSGTVPPANTLTSGTLMTRDNWRQVKEQLEL